MLEAQVTDNLKVIPTEGMLNYFGSNYSNHKMLKSNLQIQGEAVTDGIESQSKTN